MVILIVLLSFIILRAETLYVSPSATNNPDCLNLDTYACSQTDPCDLYTALCKASSNLEDDTIILLPGTYLPDPSKSFTYKALGENSGNSLTIKGSDPSNKPVIDLNNQSLIGIHIRTRGIGAGDDSTAVITVRDLIIQRVGGHSGYSALYIEVESADVNIENCEFLNGVGRGIYLSYDASYVRIKNNTFDSVAGAYISNLYSSTGPLGLSIEITGNNFSNMSLPLMIYMNKETEIFIDKNTFANNSTTTTSMPSSLLVDLRGGSKLYMRSNMLYKSTAPNYGAVAIFFRIGGGSAYIINNTFTSNSATDTSTNYGGGVYIDAGSEQADVHIYNNIFWENTTQVAGDMGEDLYISAFSTNNLFSLNLYNNLFSLNASFDPANDSGTDPNILESEDIYISNTLNYNYGGNIKINPSFVDPTTDDYHIQPTSPAKDVGLNSAPFLPLEDIDNEPRIMSDADPPAVDIGADEIAYPTPDISVNTEEYYFGELLTGESSTFTLNISNNGVAPSTLNISDISIVNEDPSGSFTITNDTCTGQNLNVGDSCSVEIRFTAVRGGWHTGEVRILSNDIDEGDLRVLLRGLGIQRFPEIEVNPASKDFGSVDMEKEYIFTVTVDNTGTGDLLISEVTLSDTFNFSIIEDTCTGNPVNPSGSCTLRIKFFPLIEGTVEAYLYIKSNDVDEQVVSVYMTAIVKANPVLSFSPDLLDFGKGKIGRDRIVKEITLKNSGTGELIIKNITLSDYQNFGVEKDCKGVSIKKGESCILKVFFSPTKEGKIEAKIYIESNDVNESVKTISLKGEGIKKKMSPSKEIREINLGCRAGTGFLPLIIILFAMLRRMFR